MKVYEVVVSWASGEGAFVDTYLYTTEEKARRSFNFEIVQAMQDYDCFDEQTGELNECNWELDKSDTHWELWETGCYTSNYCLITITEKEVIE